MVQHRLESFVLSHLCQALRGPVDDTWRARDDLEPRLESFVLSHRCQALTEHGQNKLVVCTHNQVFRDEGTGQSTRSRLGPSHIAKYAD